MHLIYVDESGNTGHNLNDAEQPVFVLGALIVPESSWQVLEADLEACLRLHFPDFAADGNEIHSSDLRSGSGIFKGVHPPKRIALRDGWLEIANKHKLDFVYRSIVKNLYQQWLSKTFDGGIIVNPHVPAFLLVSQVVNKHLVTAKAMGMFISDENDSIVREVENSIKVLRLTSGPLRLSQIIEKGFFIDSKKSRVLQLCDMCALHARKKEEIAIGGKAKAIDQRGIELLAPLLKTGSERFFEVTAWLIEEQKKLNRK